MSEQYKAQDRLDAVLRYWTAKPAVGFGVVYAMGNPCFRPDIIKVGMTRQAIKERVRELYRATGVPMPFFPLFFAHVPNPEEVERRLHRDLRQYRISPRKEFFEVTEEEVLRWFRLHIKDADIIMAPELARIGVGGMIR